MADFINVTSLNRLAKQVLAQCEPLNDLIVCGEISGFTRHYKSGHPQGRDRQREGGHVPQPDAPAEF